MIGNFLSDHIGTRSYCEDLAIRLSRGNWKPITASDKSSRPVRLLDMLDRTWRYRHHYRVALVDVFNGRAFIWAEAVCLLLRYLKKSHILVIRAGNMPQFAKKYPVAMKNLLRYAFAVTTPSRYLAQELAFLGMEIQVIPNAIDLSTYKFEQRSMLQPRLVWLRAFHRDYNPLMAIEAVGYLRADFPEIQLTMIGPDKHDGTLVSIYKAITQLGLQNNIVLREAIPKSKVPDTLASYDIFLNTTSAESFGVSVMEAAATGLCIVSTAVGELPLIWKNEYSALLIPSGDSWVMAQAVRRILTDSDLALRLSCNARATAEHYDWSTILPQWEQLLTRASLVSTRSEV